MSVGNTRIRSGPPPFVQVLQEQGNLHSEVRDEAARIHKETAPARPAAPASRRPDLSAPFAVVLMTALTSAALFLGVVVQHNVPLGRVLPLALTDPFGALAMALLAAAAVMARIGDI